MRALFIFFFCFGVSFADFTDKIEPFKFYDSTEVEIKQVGWRRLNAFENGRRFEFENTGGYVYILETRLMEDGEEGIWVPWFGNWKEKSGIPPSLLFFGEEGETHFFHLVYAPFAPDSFYRIVVVSERNFRTYFEWSRGLLEIVRKNKE